MNSTYILYLRFINSLLAVFLGVVLPIFLDILFFSSYSFCDEFFLLSLL